MRLRTVLLSLTAVLAGTAAVTFAQPQLLDMAEEIGLVDDRPARTVPQAGEQDPQAASADDTDSQGQTEPEQVAGAAKAEDDTQRISMDDLDALIGRINISERRLEASSEDADDGIDLATVIADSPLAAYLPSSGRSGNRGTEVLQAQLDSAPASEEAPSETAPAPSSTGDDETAEIEPEIGTETEAPREPPATAEVGGPAATETTSLTSDEAADDEQRAGDPGTEAEPKNASGRAASDTGPIPSVEQASASLPADQRISTEPKAAKPPEFGTIAWAPDRLYCGFRQTASADGVAIDDPEAFLFVSERHLDDQVAVERGYVRIDGLLRELGLIRIESDDDGETRHYTTLGDAPMEVELRMDRVMTAADKRLGDWEKPDALNYDGSLTAIRDGESVERSFSGTCG